MKIFNLSFEKSVGAVIFRENDKGEKEFLLLHYRTEGRSGGRNSGHWDFPKGHMEKGENEEDTLRREVKEETGLTNIEILSGFRNKISYFYRAKSNEKEEREKAGRGINIFKSVVYFMAKTKESDVVISDEHTEFEWLSYTDALNRITWDNSKNILRKAHKFLEK